jgi:hypothetical protein
VTLTALSASRKKLAARDASSLRRVGTQEQEHVVVAEVVRFDTLPVGANGSRRALVRWSDGREGEACRWYDDEILICEGDLVGKTLAEVTTLKFRRDRDHLQDER